MNFCDGLYMGMLAGLDLAEHLYGTSQGMQASCLFDKKVEIKLEHCKGLRKLGVKSENQRKEHHKIGVCSNSLLLTSASDSVDNAIRHGLSLTITSTTSFA